MKFKDFVDHMKDMIVKYDRTFDKETIDEHFDTYRFTLINLPTCETCEYWNVTNRVDTGLCVHQNLSTKHFTPKSHGCIDHSKIEQLKGELANRKDNE